jgi:hypothetical protein
MRQTQRPQSKAFVHMPSAPQRGSLAGVPEKKYIPTATPGLVRDTRTGAVINNNDAELNQYMNERARFLKQADINKKVDELSDSIDEIKEILKILVKKNGN